MADRIAAHRIIVGSGDSRKVIEPRTRFDTEEFGMSEEDVQKLDAKGVVRMPPVVSPEPEPVVEPDPVVEPAAEPNVAPVRRRRGSREDDLDDL